MYGVFSTDGSPARIGVAAGDRVLDVTAAARASRSVHADLFDEPKLDALMAAGPEVWAAVHREVAQWLELGSSLVPVGAVRLHLPFTVGDFVDFYASEHHAANLGRMLRPGQEALLPNWRHMPIGYHGRGGTVVVSGTPIRRPTGQRPSFGPSERLDLEVEVGFVIGVGSALGHPVSVDAIDQHVFGVCLVNDWSARDIQAWEYQPLGPFLGKSFATSISPWVIPLSQLRGAHVPVPSERSELLPYLRAREPWGLDIRLELRRNGDLLSSPAYSLMHWSPAQMLAHLTVNGASTRTGDLFASGTVSGPARDQWGSLIELTNNGSDGSFLDDGDEVVISATAPGLDGTLMPLGQVTGTISPATHPD